jgi:DNA-binding CsgD family transcriptional regulator
VERKQLAEHKGGAVIFRGPESLQYPSRKEFQHLAEIMYQVRGVQTRADLPQLTSAMSSLIPYQFSACGAYALQHKAFQISHTNYNAELHELYLSQGYTADPAIQLLQSSPTSLVSSEDSPELVIPREVTSLKLDFGIKTCLSIGVRGVLGQCTWFVYSNFDRKLLWKLRTMMQILAPHFHLAYMRATTWNDGIHPQATRVELTARETEIMRWVAEGKTNWEISIILHVSLNTVKFHLKNVYQKLGGVENRWAAIAQWQRQSGEILFPPSHDPNQR